MIDDIIWGIARGVYTLFAPYNIVDIPGHKLTDRERGIESYYMGQRVKYLGNDKFYIYD